MEYDAPFDPDEHGPEPIPEPSHEPEPAFDAELHGHEGADEGLDDAGYDQEGSVRGGSAREGLSPLGIALLVLVIALLSGGAYWWFVARTPPPEVADDPAQGNGSPGGQTQTGDPATGTSDPADAASIDLPPLAASDPIVRQLAQTLSEHPEVARWLASDDLVRRFVATVENIAQGESPSSHLAFMKPAGPYRAFRVDDELVTHPRSYARYDLVVDVFTSMDIGSAVQLYHQLDPLFDEAYAEIAPPGQSFDAALAVAIDRLLAVEIPETDPPLEEAVVSYRYADPQLEARSAAEKQLLRLGPERAARVQTKLQFLRAALDLDAQSP